MESSAVSVSPRPSFRSSKRLLSLRDDDHLVARAKAGEVAAFEILYERHVRGVLSFSRHMLGSREEAEDAVQQAFASAHRDLVARDREINFKPWIYTIARNRCLSMLRAQHENLPEDLERATAGLDAEVQVRADLRELVADLHDLPEEQRAALLLFEIRDLSHAEVAEVLGCKAAQVKGLVHRARAGLLERRDARNAECEEIRVELAAARGGGIRRGRLRHHLSTCPACSTYQEQVSQQRKMLAVVLPVVPTLGLKADVLAAIGFGGGAAGGGVAAATGAGAAATGGGMATATLAKLATVAVIAGGTGAAGISALDTGSPPRDASPVKPPAEVLEAPSGGIASGLPRAILGEGSSGHARRGDATGRSPAARKARGRNASAGKGKGVLGRSRAAAQKERAGARNAQGRPARGLPPTGGQGNPGRMGGSGGGVPRTNPAPVPRPIPTPMGSGSAEPSPPSPMTADSIGDRPVKVRARDLP